MHWPGLCKCQFTVCRHMPEPGVRLALALFHKHPSLTTQTLANHVLASSYHDLIYKSTAQETQLQKKKS